MPRVPPVVIYRVTGGAAYLIAWQQHPDRTWWARIIWVQCEGEAYRGAEARVDARDIAKVVGQDYSKVPRRRLDPAGPVTPPTRGTPAGPAGPRIAPGSRAGAAPIRSPTTERRQVADWEAR